MEDKEWFSAKEAGRILGVNPKTVRSYQRNGTITHYQEEPYLLVHRDEVLKLQKKGFRKRNTEEIVRDRIKVTFSPLMSNAMTGEDRQQVHSYPCIRANT